jgi:hypothetical protein
VPVAGVRRAGGVLVRAARAALARGRAAAELRGAALVIALGMAEAATCTSTSPSSARPASASALRGAVSRVLALLVVMGCGVVRPAMAGVSARVVGFGVAFFVAAEALEVAENVGAVSDRSPSPTRRMFLALPVAALNSVFVYWTFSVPCRGR